MGVKGLSSFFSQNPSLSENFRLHDSSVVIDGFNLLCYLYFNNDIDSVHGGDFNEYAKIVRNYISIFLECNLKPIIIFDGGYEERKMKTLIERYETCLTTVQAMITDETQTDGRSLPIMAFKVFCLVLSDLGVPFAQCDYEADDQVPALANHYNCPVISNDSDFYIFDIHSGFIRLDSINMSVNQVTDSNGSESKFLNCNIYFIDKFISCFPGLDKMALPLMATLVGNDFVDAGEFNNFFRHVQFRTCNSNESILCNYSQHKKILNVLCWLQDKTVNQAIEKIIHYFNDSKRHCIKSTLENSGNLYKLNHHALSFIIDQNVNDLKNQSILRSKLATRCGHPLPVDFVVKFHQGELSTVLVNVITHLQVFLQPQISNMNFPSSHMCARHIRQILYGILIRHDTDNGQCENQRCLSYIKEYDCQEGKVTKKFVKPKFSLEGFGALPNINEIYSLPEDKCKEIILKVLGVSSEYLSNLPDEWQLLICCINYWLRNCSPHSSEALVFAIILNIIYFSLQKCKNFLFDKMICTKKSSILSREENKTFTSTKCSCSITCIVSSISESSLEQAKENLKCYTEKLPFSQDSLDIVHGYSQLQACILPTVFLNELLGNVMEDPILQFCINGTMLCNLAKSFASCPYPKMLVAKLLGQDNNLNLLFTQLFSVLCHNVPDDYFKKNSCHRKNKTPEKKNCSSGVKV